MVWTAGLHYFDKETVPYEAMAEPVYMRFEDREFPIPCGYDVYLKALYGELCPKNYIMASCQSGSGRW